MLQELRQTPFWKSDIRQEQETNNLLSNLHLMAGMALLREESRGSHFRSDHPARDDQRWRRRITARYDGEQDQVIYETILVDEAPEIVDPPSASGEQAPRKAGSSRHDSDITA